MEEKIMSEEFTEQKEQLLQEDPVQTEPDTVLNDAGTENAPKKKISKEKLIIIGAAAVVLAIVLAIILIPSKFKRVENKCFKIVGMMQTGKNYFSLDTDPYENMDKTLRALLLPDMQDKVLEAIRYANNELGFPGSVYSDMMRTTALMGRQTEENNKYKVSWTYHPDRGLEVTYTKK